MRVFSAVLAFGFCIAAAIVTFNPSSLMGGDAYNAIIAAGRGNVLACVGIVFAVLACIPEGNAKP